MVIYLIYCILNFIFCYWICDLVPKVCGSVISFSSEETNTDSTIFQVAGNRNLDMTGIIIIVGENDIKIDQSMTPKALYNMLIKEYGLAWSVAKGYFKLSLDGHFLSPLDDETLLFGYKFVEKIYLETFKYTIEESEFIKHDHFDGPYHVPEHYQNYYTLYVAVTTNGWALNYAPKILIDVKEIVLAAVSSKGGSLRFAPYKFQNDKEVVLTAVRRMGWAIEYASTNLKNDKEVLLSAMIEKSSVISEVSQEIIKDRKFMLDVVEKKPNILEYVPNDFCFDRSFFLAAIKRNCGVLKYVKAEFLDDKEIVIALLESCQKFSLKSVSLRLIEDEDVVLAALKQNSKEFVNASKSLKNEVGFILKALKTNFDTIVYIPDEIRQDPQFMVPFIVEYVKLK